MTKFKPKTNKNIKVDERSILTVDKKHDDMLEQIKSSEDDYNSLKIKYKSIKAKLLDPNIDVNSRILCKDKQLELKQRLKECKNARKTYYLDHSKYIFEYFENKKHIIDDNNKKTIVNNFFKVNKKPMDPPKKPNHIRYFSNLDDSFISVNDYVEQFDKCKVCGHEMISIEHEGVIVCTKCFVQTEYLVEHDKPSYKEPPKEVSFYAYKRINHFREIIAQFQAKESTHIDDEVIENIKKQIKKERISLDQMTNDKTKQILKNLGYNKYYEHISFIKEKLGIFPPRMSVELEQKLCNLFMEIQKPYSKYCPIDRVNFLNYYFVLYKLCELLGEDEYLPYFYMLKDPEKRNEQDEIWKEICKELKWEFIPTP